MDDREGSHERKRGGGEDDNISIQLHFGSEAALPRVAFFTSGVLASELRVYCVRSLILPNIIIARLGQ
jgi:hypothetical protein